MLRFLRVRHSYIVTSIPFHYRIMLNPQFDTQNIIPQLFNENKYIIFILEL